MLLRKILGIRIAPYAQNVTCIVCDVSSVIFLKYYCACAALATSISSLPTFASTSL